MLLGQRLTIVLLGIALALGLLTPAHAQEPAPTTLELTAAPDFADRDTPVQVVLRHKDGSPVAGAQVLLERRTDGVWAQAALLTTNDEGRASTRATLSRDKSDNRFRASYAGDGTTSAPSRSGGVTAPLERRHSKVKVGGPERVVDEKSVDLDLSWFTGHGEPVAGTIRLMRRNPGGSWKLFDKVRSGDDGRATVTVKPRVDTRWKGVVRKLDWVTGDASRVHRIDNLPPGVPVNLPKGAPRPRVNVPDQARAVGVGAHPVVRRVPDRVWKQMTGRSWHRGCPVGRPSLRFLRINYWDYRGYRRRGELVAHADAVHQMAAALADMYAAKLPIRAMYRVDRFGYSARLRGGDDYRSMAAGNTSAFNCRQVVGNPGARSPHSYGRSLDLNTWENPYRSRQGTVPNTWWMGHSHPRVAWRSRDHRVVRIMARHGLRWTYGNGDTQHFDAAPGSGRVSASWATTFLECHGVCD